MFIPSDYEGHTQAIDDFQTRHSTITDRIDMTSKIGLKLDEYLEN